jgi:uncharacterized repeat protein (TIGR01451 family)
MVSSTTVPASTTTAGVCTITVNVTNVAGQSGTCPDANLTNSSTNISGVSNINNAVQPSCVTVVAQADLAISKTDGVTTVTSGGSTVYTIVVTNNGPGDANGAVVTDPVATGLTKTAVSCTGTTLGRSVSVAVDSRAARSGHGDTDASCGCNGHVERYRDGHRHERYRHQRRFGCGAREVRPTRIPETTAQPTPTPYNQRVRRA